MLELRGQDEELPDAQEGILPYSKNEFSRKYPYSKNEFRRKHQYSKNEFNKKTSVQ
jgi:hypothetical protein